ncbi:glypican-5-like isoform X1 [Scophthalmus maximus]|uniref:glypican-5-like isoform X1 n=2 Tax=Scophthalmus maximus TaxID=52904 RepID=UPI001FA92555|nr:glypican-5-like isoform X1 [Scophthalmus maximus]
MSRAASRSADLSWVILLCVVALGAADADSCHEVKTAYVMRQIGPVELVPDRPAADESLRVCAHPGLTCCTSKMEDSYMAAVRGETQQKMQSYSFELQYLIAGHARAYRETFESLVSFTSNLTSSLFDSAYSALASDCRPLVSQLFGGIGRHLSGDSDSSLDGAVRRFYNDLFPLVYRRLLNPGVGHTALRSFSSTTHDDCLRLTRQDVGPFGPHPRLLVSSLSRALGVGRALSRLLRLAGEVVNATEKATYSRECSRGLVRMQYCSHCRGLTLIRPCTGLCVNVMRGCLVGVSELAAPWGSLVVLLQRLAATLATSSNHNSMELALLAVRNHVNDAILHAQLHGPRITATVEKVCGPQEAGPVVTSRTPSTSHVTTSVTPATSERSSVTPPPSAGPVAHQRLQQQSQRSFPLKGSRGDKSRSLKKLSREFEGSIQRYQWFFSELPEMLCESEMEVEQHTCWSGQDVAESYAGRVVGSTLKAQRENPEMTVRNTDPVLKGTKLRMEQLTQELLVELGWASKAKGRGEEEEEEGGSTQTDGGSGNDCDDEDGCEASGERNGDDTGDSSSGHSPEKKKVARPPPHRPVPPHHLSPPQVYVPGSAHTVTAEPFTLTLVTLPLLLLSPWQPR